MHRTSMIEGIQKIVKMATKTLSTLVTDCSLQSGTFLPTYESFYDVKWNDTVIIN